MGQKGKEASTVGERLGGVTTATLDTIEVWLYDDGKAEISISNKHDHDGVILLDSANQARILKNLFARLEKRMSEGTE